jgi:hypothetical protein
MSRLYVYMSSTSKERIYILHDGVSARGRSDGDFLKRK